jgi:hypothetical protein
MCSASEMVHSRWSNLSRPTSRMFSFFEINRIYPGPWSCMRASFLSFSLYPVLVLVSNEMKTTFKTLHKYDDVGARCLFICDHCCNEESVRKRIIEESCETRKRLSCILQQSSIDVQFVEEQSFQSVAWLSHSFIRGSEEREERFCL